MTLARPFTHGLLWIALPGFLTGAAAWGAIDTQSAASAPATNVSTATNTSQPSDVTAEQLAQRIAALIGQLGDKNYLVRQSAQNELSRIGPKPLTRSRRLKTIPTLKFLPALNI